MKNSTIKQTSPIRITYDRFSPEDIVRIRASSHTEAAYVLGKTMRLFTAQIVRKYEKKWRHKRSALDAAKHFLTRLDTLSQSRIGAMGGVHYVKRYRDIFDGYARGAGITREACMMLQMEISGGCQTLFVKNTDGVSGFHIEENAADMDLFSHLVDKKPYVYPYRLIEADIQEERKVFFSYPGLCWGGSTFGLDVGSGIFNAVDAFDLDIPWSEKKTRDVTANAVASILFEVTDMQKAATVLSSFKKNAVAVYGGYAYHMVTADNLASFEYGATVFRRVPPYRQTYIAQCNIPRTSALVRLCVHKDAGFYSKKKKTRKQIMYTLSLKQRWKRLKNVAMQLEDPDQIDEILAGTNAPVERTSSGRFVFDRYTSPWTASYVTFARNVLHMHKYGPLHENGYSYIYHRENPAHRKLVNNNTWKKAVRKWRRVYGKRS